MKVFGLHLCRRYSCSRGAPLPFQFQLGRTNVWAQEGSHRLGGARFSHTHRICKEFNNEPLTPNHRDRSGVNKGLYICKSKGGPGPIKVEPGHKLLTVSLWHLLDLQVTEQHSENMVKYFSVDWLAQSHHNTEPREDHGDVTDTAPTCRPHIPCMVQPRPPTYGKGYLQPKPRSSKPTEHMDQMENSTHQDSSLCSPLHPTNCSSPSKFNFKLHKNTNLKVCEIFSIQVWVFLTRVFLPFSFRNQRLLLRVWERSCFLWVSVCGWGKRGGERGITAACAH